MNSAPDGEGDKTTDIQGEMEHGLHGYARISRILSTVKSHSRVSIHIFLKPHAYIYILSYMSYSAK